MPRAKGTPNYNSLTVGEICKRLKFNPIQDLIRLRSHEDASLELQAKITNDLLPYIYPKLTAVQVSGAITHTVEADQEIKKMIGKVFCHE